LKGIEGNNIKGNEQDGNGMKGNEREGKWMKEIKGRGMEWNELDCTIGGMELNGME